MAATAVSQHVDYNTDPDEYVSQLFALCVIQGIIFILCGLFRLGGITALISDCVLAGFTAASAYNIGASQLVNLFGLESVYSSKGPFFPYIIEIFDHFSEINWTSFAICLSSIIILIVGKWANKKWLPKVPIPFELVVVIFFTFISYVGKLDVKNGIAIVGNIEGGYPKFHAPSFKNIGSYILASIPLCLISYVIAISSGKSLGRQHDYRVRPNQELRALGLGCFLGGFLECIPITGSMARSFCAGSYGAAVTPMYNAFSYILLTLVVLFIAPALKYLPKAILGALVIAAFDKIYPSFLGTGKIFLKSKLEFLHWWVTFIATIFLDTEYGLYIGIGFSLITQLLVILKVAHDPSDSYYNEFTRLFGFDVYHDHISDSIFILFYSINN